MRAAKSSGRGAGAALLFGPNGGPKGKEETFFGDSPPPPLSMDLYDRASALSQGLDPALFCTFLCLR